MPEILPANVAGGAMALINSMGALGSFGGSWLVGYLNGATGSPAASYLFMCGALLCAVALTAALNNSTTSGRAKTPCLRPAIPSRNPT